MKKEESRLWEKITKNKRIFNNNNYNFVIKIVCLLAAICLWFYMDSLENPKITANIENIVVELRNEESISFPEYDYEIFTGRNKRINIAVKGTEENIEKYKNNIVAYVDLRESKFDENTLTRLFNIYIDKKTVPNGIEIVSQSEDVMIVAIDKVVEKTFDNFTVNPDLGEQTMEDGYSIGNEIGVKHNSENVETITIRGPENIIQKVKNIEISVDCRGRTRSFTASGNVVLLDEFNIPISDEDIKYVEVTPKNLIVEVPIIKEQNYKLEIRGNKTGENIYKYVNVEIIPSEVTIYGDTFVMEKDNLILPIEIDETAIVQRNGFYSSKIVLETAGGVSIVGGYQATVNLRIDFQKVKDTNYWISSESFQAINVDPNISNYEILEDRIRIRVRGAETIIDQLTSTSAQEKHGGDIIAYIDMSDFDENTVGVQKVPLKFEFDISNLQDSVLTEEEQQIYIFEIGPEPYYIDVDFGNGENVPNE